MSGDFVAASQGKLLIFRLTPRGLRRPRLEAARSSRISAITDLWNFVRSRGGIEPKVAILRRRNLQRASLDAAVAKLSGPNTDEKSLYRAELKSLETALTTAVAKSVDKSTSAHLEAAKAQIGRALNPKL